MEVKHQTFKGSTQKKKNREISAALIIRVFTFGSALRADCEASSCLYTLIFLAHFFLVKYGKEF